MIRQIVFDKAQTAVTAAKKINLAAPFFQIDVFEMRLKTDEF